MSEQPAWLIIDETIGDTVDPIPDLATRRLPRRWPYWATAAIVLVLLASQWMSSQTTAMQQPVTVPVMRGDLFELVSAAGIIQPRDWVDVGAQVSGQLHSMNVHVGDFVKQGALLAQIDAAVQHNRVVASRASLDAEQAHLSARGATLELAQANHDRQSELFEQSLTSRVELDAAVNQLSKARAALAELQFHISRSQASLASDEAQLNYSRIFAPMTGTVVRVDKTVGQTLNASQQVPTILRIADLGTMTVQADVSEADINSIHSGGKAYFTTLGGGERRWYGEVRQVLPTPNVRGGAVFYPVLFDVPNPDGVLLPQMTAQVFFVVAEAVQALQVPAATLQYSDGRADVATVTVLINNDVQHRQVTVGISDRINTQILTGLSVQDRIVTGWQ